MTLHDHDGKSGASFDPAAHMPEGDKAGSSGRIAPTSAFVAFDRLTAR
ncbi:hypothetical protein PAF17_02125 [Paracoccus sp. Z330]|uniref:Uncharacterized protein n=1 Tax=Paracoccus onchidii TaxID=3017813 RepID=A0ABT4ZAM0_9RHOB|nr:hypothetical protein [Paracoccus onchidii]MDB6176300.1 hypothetical protein [Paracoccus onchidii]